MPEVLIDLSDGGVATLTLNRPHRKNGITKTLVDEAIDALQLLGAGTDCRVLVLTGAGRAFCSGMDLSEPIAPDEVTFMRRVGQLCRAGTCGGSGGDGADQPLRAGSRSG
ncbi:Hydroxycinnamoyl-CoA hydratase-lyase [Mycolicibacterium vanbaalenii]|uniref:Hydroxycinnamoyl-CoA hydratase-lyase n=1 Tax=Mycolicibacterium vanbaalenii TaxID=110539 RepID=A0A5S9R675_MYCVN|nr:enoyl-CoA hydratase/isomerase family protein [Mycolicibacterium vanbaalenii]CAA0129978.1 Hydroxycinnamoyl-CoA hydratase-lyase [Mycolicibacterium vanbaalenii]